MYTFPQKQVLYTLVELSGGLFYVGSLKICLISLGLENGLDVVLIQYLTDAVCCFLYIWKNGKDSLTIAIFTKRGINNGSRHGDNP